MADKFKKIGKEFLLTNSSLNQYKYRLLTAGYLMSEYQKNPIGYYMHKRLDGVLLRWTDFRLDGDDVWAKPIINMSNQRGRQTVDEIESGFLNGASMGHFVILGVSDNPSDYLEGQEGPSVNKWYNRECSLVDIPGNYESLTDLYDANDNPLKLDDLIAQQKKIQMEKIFLTPEQLTKMLLKADARQEDVNNAIADLVAKAAKVDVIEKQLNAANTAKDQAEQKYNDLVASSIDKEVTDELATAVKDKKITVEMQKVMAVQYKGKAVELKALIATMKPYESVVDGLMKNTVLTDTDAVKKYNEMDKEGSLENLKAENPEEFKRLYKARFKKEYAEA